MGSNFGSGETGLNENVNNLSVGHQLLYAGLTQTGTGTNTFNCPPDTKIHALTLCCSSITNPITGADITLDIDGVIILAQHIIDDSIGAAEHHEATGNTTLCVGDNYMAGANVNLIVNVLGGAGSVTAKAAVIYR